MEIEIPDGWYRIEHTAKMKILTGRKIGRLAIGPAVRPTRKCKYQMVYYVVRCDCGTEKVVRTSSLLGRKKGQYTRSCGCWHREVTSKRSIGKHGGYASNALYQVYRAAAKKRGIE